MFGVEGWLWWRKVILPGIFPYYVTGAITASGGSWNAAIVAEVVTWGDDHARSARARRLYRATPRLPGDYPRIVLGVAVMSVFVIAFNRCCGVRCTPMPSRRLPLR